MNLCLVWKMIQAIILANMDDVKDDSGYPSFQESFFLILHTFMYKALRWKQLKRMLKLNIRPQPSWGLAQIVSASLIKAYRNR